ncbi:MAG: hypothetical protein IK121_02995 [Lachnospiraceae bacterium]|nr:hypothetical protein [Lachnospiraceae bacterium]
MTEAAQITRQSSVDMLNTAEETKNALDKLEVLLNDILDETGTEPRDELDRVCYLQRRENLNFKAWIASDYLNKAKEEAARLMTLCKELKGIA